MNIKNILENIDYKLIKGTVDLDIEKIEHDSRKVKKGDIFLAMRGFSVDGHKFIGKAIENGAIAIIITEDIDVDFDITVIQLKNDMDIIAKMISNYYENPSYKLNMIGITGTNGKTSITYMLKNIFEASSKKIGLVGTMGSLINNQLVGNKNTTPDNLELQRQLNEMVKADTEYCFMEVSSHSLDMKRVSGLNFDIGVFINLTEDHLDYHGTMDSYFESKKKLFYRTGRANIINIDDDYGKKLIDELKSKSKVEIISYGLDCKADICAKNISFSNRGLSYTLKSQNGQIDIEMKLLGEFNIYNSLAAASVALSYGFTLEDIKKGLESIEGIKGRFELLETETDYSVIIDFAHTPDGLKQVLKSVRDFSKGNIYCVFGAGGNRDKLKRPIMGEIVGKYADIPVVTSDNPRFEDPKNILKDVLEGVKITNKNYVDIVDRKDAIKYALENAEKEDIIILAGKGHEDYISIDGKNIHFDEREVVKELLSEMRRRNNDF